MPHLDQQRIGVTRGVFQEITDADDAFLAIVGYSRADFEHGALSWPAMTPPEYLHLDEAGMRQAAESGGFTMPYRKQFFRKDGSRVDVLLVCAFIPETEGGWIGYVVDLTPPSRALPSKADESLPLSGPAPTDMLSRLVGELVRERTRMLAMLDGANARIWSVDRDLKLLSCNSAFHRAQRAVSGREMSIGEVVLDTANFPESHWRPWVEWYGRGLAGETFTTTMHYDGPERHASEFLIAPIVANDEIMGVTIVSQDISERVEAERRAQLHEQRFEHLVQSVPVGVLVADSEGRLMTINARTQQILAPHAEALNGLSHLAFVEPGDHAALGSLWPKARTTGEAECTVTVRRQNGEARRVRWRVEPLEIADVAHSNAAERFVGIVEDETERLAAVELNRQREKMESLGTLAGGVAHDFNNLLTVILSGLETARSPEATPDDMTESLDHIASAAQRARDLVKQILTFSRRDLQSHQPVDLAAIVSDTMKLLRSALPADLTVDVIGATQPISILGDASALQQVVLNLVMNAAHATRGLPSPTIAITLHRSPGVDGECVVLRVSDNGKGMSREVCDRIFEPFFTTKPIGEGTGMGLAVVRGAVESHHGSIVATSAPGAGTTFTITVPVLTA